MKLTPVNSSNIDAVGYEPTGKLLFVRFKSGADVYQYAGVPEATYKALISAESVGGYFHKHIKPLPFTKVVL